MKKNCLIITEGAHDEAVIGIILIKSGFKKAEKKDDVPPELKSLIPNVYPNSDGIITGRFIFFSFYKKDNITVVVAIAGGDSQIKDRLEAVLIIIDKELWDSLAIILDDDKYDIAIRFRDIKQKLADLYVFLRLKGPGEILLNNNRKEGIYILPNNQQQGDLEDILLECGDVLYPESIKLTRDYVNQIKNFDEIDKRELEKYEKKAIIGCISNMHRPGNANQVAISAGKWITEEIMEKLETVRLLTTFIRALFE